MIQLFKNPACDFSPWNCLLIGFGTGALLNPHNKEEGGGGQENQCRVGDDRGAGVAVFGKLSGLWAILLAVRELTLLMSPKHEASV